MLVGPKPPGTNGYCMIVPLVINRLFFFLSEIFAKMMLYMYRDCFLSKIRDSMFLSPGFRDFRKLSSGLRIRLNFFLLHFFFLINCNVSPSGEHVRSDCVAQTDTRV